MKKILILFLFFLPIISFAEVSSNTGFIPGQIWYSQDPLMDGENVNIYTLLWNGSDSTLSFKVEFYDKTTVLGTREANVESLHSKEISIPWKVTSGDHIISAKIVSSTLAQSGKTEKVIIDRDETKTDKKSVEVVVKKDDGESVLSSDLVSNEIEKVGDAISDNVSPIANTIIDKIENAIPGIDTVRKDTLVKINESKDETKNDIKLLSDSEKKDTEKPILYLKLLFLSLLSFIFSSKIFFYLVLLLLVFTILRFIYKKFIKKT